MSFVRPEARAAIRRWGEPAVALALLLAALGPAAALLDGGGIWSVFALGVVVLAALWLRAALLRAFLRREGLGPGIVALREGELGYFGPETGGVVALDDIAGVEVVPGAGGEGPAWRIWRADGGSLDVPVGAAGSEAVPQALAALPGFSERAALDALSARGSAPRRVWTRSTAPRISGAGAPPRSSGR